MTNILLTRLSAAPVVPLVQSNDPEQAVAISKALLEGGLQVLEVVLRTEAAYDCLSAITKAFPKALVGAGTVLSGEQTELAIKKGAKFIVSPGLNAGVVSAAKKHDLPILPGIATATELQTAWNMGLRIVKFFPASLAGGPKMLKALSSVFRDVRFMPTGGVSPENLMNYLDIPAVIACGGSWLTPMEAIQRRDFQAIEDLSRQALTIVQNREK